METYVIKQDNSNYLNDICYKKYINKIIEHWSGVSINYNISIVCFSSTHVPHALKMDLTT